jgi:hypothetical protein
MSHPFDATLKELLTPNPDDFVPVFGLPRPAGDLGERRSVVLCSTL